MLSNYTKYTGKAIWIDRVTMYSKQYWFRIKKKKKKGLGHPDIIQSLKRQVRLGNTNNLKMKTIVTGYTLQFKVK